VDDDPEFIPPVSVAGVGGFEGMPEDMPPDDAAEPVDIALPEPLMPLALMPLAGAMLPGEAPGAGEAAAAFGAPVGAGDEDAVWAIATPAVKQSAAEASHSERMKNLLK
jgi:hypothetical protein